MCFFTFKVREKKDQAWVDFFIRVDFDFWSSFLRS
jgi:hypothetical protein